MTSASTASRLLAPRATALASALATMLTACAALSTAHAQSAPTSTVTIEMTIATIGRSTKKRDISARPGAVARRPAAGRARD